MSPGSEPGIGILTDWEAVEKLSRRPAPYYLGLNLCRCSILIIVRSAQPIASE